MGWAALSASADRVARARLGGVSVTAGAVSGIGIFNKGGELIIDDRRSVNVYELNVPTALFGDLRHGDPITVAGESYEVRYEPQMLGGGENCLLYLSKLDVTLARILLEDGGFMLTEDGGYVLLEDS